VPVGNLYSAVAVTSQSANDGRKPGSLTWAGLFNTYYWIDPTMRVAGLIMMQILPFADRQALKAYRQFERGICHALGPA
jgi:CubicO group peptidase (beta-lactamase class C family)